MSDRRFSAIWQLSLVRARLYYRQPGTLFWTLGAPLVLTIVLGLAFGNRRSEPVVVAVESAAGMLDARAERARTLLAADGDIVADAMPPERAAAALRTGRVSLVVVPSPDGYAYRFDPTRPESRLARALADGALQRGEGRRDAFVGEGRIVTEPGSRYIDFLVPGLIAMGLMSWGLWGIGSALVELRVKKLLKRLMATPMRRSDFLLSFLVVRCLVLFIEVPPLLLFAKLAFDVRVHGSFGALAVVVVAGGLSFAAIGLLVAARAESTQAVGALINAVSFPMMLCSGVFFSAARLPPFVQPLIRALPLTAEVDAMREVMTEGASLSAVASQLGIVAAWGIAAFVVALRLFKWR